MRGQLRMSGASASGARRARQAPNWRSPLAWLAAVAVLVHCLVVQAHIDFGPHSLGGAAISGLASAASVDQGANADGSGGAAPTACFICEAAAFAGGTILGAAATQPPVQSAYLQLDPLHDGSVATVRRSHAWRSRAPPRLG